MICKMLKYISFKLQIKKKYKLMKFSLEDSLGSSFYSFELLKDQKKKNFWSSFIDNFFMSMIEFKNRIFTCLCFLIQSPYIE